MKIKKIEEIGEVGLINRIDSKFNRFYARVINSFSASKELESFLMITVRIL